MGIGYQIGNGVRFQGLPGPNGDRYGGLPHSKGQDIGFNVFKGGDDYEVVVEFDSWAGDLVGERKWHVSQEVTELRGRQVRLRLRLNSIEEAERWVLGWGTHATVIRPDRLRERVAAAAGQVAAKYAV
jgi:predicted DNA-binding transcriptional regulator YafY